MRCVIPIACLLIFYSSAFAQTFTDFINRAYSLPAGERPALVDSFMDAVESFPFIEFDTVAHYIYRGNATRVNVPGDANNWNANEYPMTSLSGTNFWYYTHLFEADARLDYKYVISNSTWILDPLNPYTCTGGFGPNSELRMPAYVMPPEIEYRPAIPHGSLQDTMFASTYLGNTRRIRVYTPPDYDALPGIRYPMILFHDGLEYVTLANANNVLDYLIWQQRIEPVIAVFVPPVNRTSEYAGEQQNAFTNFIVHEVIPWVDGRFLTQPDAAHRAMLGASYGGNISLWHGLQHPEVFGKIAAQSAYVQPSIQTGFASGPVLDLMFYLDMGTYDIPSLPPLVDQLAATLETRGYSYQYEIYHEGHSWGNWRAHIDNALERFFPYTVSAPHNPPSSVPGEWHLKIFPNPFNATTQLTFVLPAPGRVTAQLYDISGRLVRTLTAGYYSGGNHDLTIDSTGLTSGLYFARCNYNQNVRTQKLLLIK